MKCVCVLIWDRNYKVLSVSRKNNPQDKGLVGGKVESNESEITALIREVKEETGLDVLNFKLIYTDTDDNNNLVETYICKCEGKISTQEKGVVEFVDYSELLKGSFRNYNLNLLDIFINNFDRNIINEYISHIRN